MKFNLNTKKRKDKNGNVIKLELWYSYSIDGKRVRKPLGLEDTKFNRKLVKDEIFPDMLVKLRTGELSNNKNDLEEKIPYLNDYIIESIDLHKHQRNKDTHDDYISIFKNHIKEFFNKKKLDKVKPSDIEKWQNYLLDKGLSPIRVKKMRCLLSIMFKDAQKDEIIDKNPLSLVKCPKIPKTVVNPFTINEIDLILSNSNGQYQNFYAFAVLSGARSGELLGLTWRDIDINSQLITIQRSIKMGKISSPKTDNSTRTIDIIDSLLPYIKNQYSLTGKYDSYVFLNQKKTHFHDIRRIRDNNWKKTLKKCNLEYRPIYQTRHTFATLMLSNNEDILWVSYMLGHTDPSMTLSKYSRFIKRDRKERASFLNSKFKS